MSETARAKDGSTYEFIVKKDPPAGGMKYVFFSPKKDYVVAFFKEKPDARAMARLESIVGKYREDIYGQVGGDYWKSLFCWPEKIVEWNGNVGIVVPTYEPHFFFQIDKNLKGKEKEGKWFASAKLIKGLEPEERGDFLKYLKICHKISCAVRRMHAAGLAHSDLSYRNVLIDPHGANACIIDVDGLVVPGKYPPEVLGTPDFIAPEVLCDKSHKILPSQTTDRHALAVLIYLYLLHRHPLRGGRYFGDDVETEDEEEMLMGSQPLYIEHPTDKANRNMKREYGDDFDRCKPWVDLDKFSADKIVGPFIAKLFTRAFVDGLQNPSKRPIPGDWEQAIVKTTDRILPCSNRSCAGKYFVFNDDRPPVCPFCGTPYKGIVPKLEFYSCRPGSNMAIREERQLIVWDGMGLHKWHANRLVFPNEKLSLEDRKRQGYFRFVHGKWVLVNECLPSLYEVVNGQKIQKRPKEYIVLENGKQITLSAEDGGRIALVQFAGV